MTTKSIGRYWWERCWFPSGHPLIQRGIGAESDHPWRTGGCIIVRLPLTRKGAAFGIWTGSAPIIDTEDGPILAMRDMDWEDFHAVEK